MKSKYKGQIVIQTTLALLCGLTLSACSASDVERVEELPVKTYGDLDAGQNYEAPEGISVYAMLEIDSPKYLGTGIFASGTQDEVYTYDLAGLPSGFAAGGSNESFASMKLLGAAHSHDYVVVSGDTAGDDLGKGEEVLALLKKSTGEVLWKTAPSEIEPLFGVYDAATVGPGGVFTTETTESGKSVLIVRSLENGEVIGTYPSDKYGGTLVTILSGDPLTLLVAGEDDSNNLTIKAIDPSTGEVTSSETVEEDTADTVERDILSSNPFLADHIALLNGAAIDSPEVRTLGDGRTIDDSDGTISLSAADGNNLWSLPTTGRIAEFNEHFALIKVIDKEQFALLRTEDGELLGTIPFNDVMYNSCEYATHLIAKDLLTVECENNTALFSLKF